MASSVIGQERRHRQQAPDVLTLALANAAITVTSLAPKPGEVLRSRDGYWELSPTSGLPRAMHDYDPSHLPASSMLAAVRCLPGSSAVSRYLGTMPAIPAERRFMIL